MTILTVQANLTNIWSNKQLSIQTKLNLYNSLVLSILLYGSEAWTLTASWEQHLDVFDTKCLRRILGLHWYDFVPNTAVCQMTKQPPISQLIRPARLRLFGHLARSSPLSEPARLILEPTPRWRRPRGRPRMNWLDQLTSDLAAVNMDLPTAWQAAQDRSFWRRCRGATLPGASGLCE